ncbi:MAG TPA: ABC transporter substrate-binding protein [Acidimicrobiales bacterium]
MRRTTRVIVGLLALSSLVLASCSSDDGGDASPETTVGEAATADPNGVAKVGYDLVSNATGGFSWDPSATVANVGNDALLNVVYGGLMRLALDGKPEPDLAESVTIVNGTTIDVVLRDGVTYPDGSALDAALVKQVLDKNLANPTNTAFAATFYDLDSVEVTGDLTLRLTIPGGTANGWYDTYMGQVETLVVPPNTNFSMPAAAGPYDVTEFSPGRSATLTKNADYWDVDAIQVPTIELVNVQGEAETAATSALNAGQVEFAAINFLQLEALGSGIEPIINPSASQLIGFQTCNTQPPFDNEKLRLALNRALDRDAINDALYEGTGIPAYGIWPEGHPYYPEGLAEEYAYDPEAAKQLLTEAGYPDGITFDVMPMTAGGMPEVAQIVQQQWAQIGVDVTLKPTDAIVQDFYTEKEAPIGLIPVMGLTPRLNRWVGDTVNNFCDYDDPDLNAMAAEALTLSASSDEAVTLWQEITEKMSSEGLDIPVLYGSNVSAYNADKLGDVKVMPYQIPFPYVWELYVKA